MEQYKYLDLIQDQFEVLEYKVANDLDNFLKLECWYLSNRFYSLGGYKEDLKAELQELTLVEPLPLEDSDLLIEEWSGLYDNMDLANGRICKLLLHYLYLVFIETDTYQAILDKLRKKKASSIPLALADSYLDWMSLWAFKVYPSIALLVFDKARINRFKLLSQFELDDIILHLPPFMLRRLNICFTPSFRALSKELASGINIRRCKNNPIRFTKKMAHNFHNSEWSASMQAAFWSAIILTYGGDHRLVEAFGNFTARNKDLPFIQAVVNFFMGPGLEINGPELLHLLAYLQHLQDEGEFKAMKGWTLQSLRRRADAYYQEINQRHLGAYQMKSWSGAPYSNYETTLDGTKYVIVQLLSGMALNMEGKKMRHCVGSYAYSCTKGLTSIWSLRKIERQIQVPLVTIEVKNNKKIVQARGPFNKRASAFCRQLIRSWANKEGLSF